MKERDRVFHDITYSVKPVPNKLNLLDMSTWIKPEAGEHHWLFDIIIHTLACGQADKIEHLERLIAFKYTNPDCPTLPALVIHGEGTCGKNLLVEQVLSTLFAGAVCSGTVDTLMGQFNTPLIGKVVGLIDEASAKKVNHDKLKNMLGSSVFWANEKGLRQYECPALAWIIISSNKHEGGIFLDRSGADRRYSIFHVEAKRDLYFWLTPILNAATDREHTVEEATIWLKEHFEGILCDKTQVSHWIHALIEKHKGKSIPLAYHGDDFHRMMDIQKPVEELLIPDVFNDPEFSHINRVTLYEGYKILSKNDERQNILSSRYFYARVRAWLKANKPDMISEIDKQHRQKEYDSGNRCWIEGKTAWLWHTNTARESTIKTANDHKYVDTSDRYRPTWVGPQGR